MKLNTKRLYIREITKHDLNALRAILQDEEVMFAYEHAFDEEEVQAWYERQLYRYQHDGYGLWAVVLNDTNQMIGQCGLTNQMVNNTSFIEIGYLFQKAYWHQGFASEAAFACMQYAFQQYPIHEVYSIIRDQNIPSQKVAIRNGMKVSGSFVKHYYGIDMPHDIYRITREEYEAKYKK